MGYRENSPTQIHEDNQGAIKYIHSKETHGRMKHIDIKHLFVRQLATRKVISVEYVPTAKNPADILTKSISSNNFEEHRGTMGLSDCCISLIINR
jgi:hypothetical protein